MNSKNGSSEHKTFCLQYTQIDKIIYNNIYNEWKQIRNILV